MTKEHFNESIEEARRTLEESLFKIANKEYTFNEGQMILLSSIAVLQLLTIEAITGFEVTNELRYSICCQGGRHRHNGRHRRARV